MKHLKNVADALTLRTFLSLSLFLSISFPTPSLSTEFSQIANTYVGLASSIYSDSLNTARQLSADIDVFLDEPTEANLSIAKNSWQMARNVYSQSEVFRFGNPIVDDWEPQVNAWPLDEGFIDYVDGNNYFYELGNPVGKANIIASESLRWGSNNLNLSVITAELLSSLNELGGTEANVATGWHAIEFMLWGQDLNGYEAGAGERPATDFSANEHCSNGNCDRRRQYLKAATELLIEDLEFIVATWNPSIKGSYGQEFLSFSTTEQMRRILYGMGSLALGELAGERMKVALFANSSEDEHDCFSDQTHNTLYNDALGIVGVLRGHYVMISGEAYRGFSLLDWAMEEDSELASSLSSSAAKSLAALSKIVVSAEAGTAFDQLIAPGNQAGAALITDSIDALKLFTRDIELLATAMDLETLTPDNAGHSF